MRLPYSVCGVTIAIFASALLASSHPGVPAPGQGSTEIGFLKWEARDAATARILARGEKPIYLQDVVIRDVMTGNGRYTPKYIRLNEQYSLKMAEFPSRALTEGEGFGIVGLTSDLPSQFSWEWFTIKSPERAVKLQESGELRIQKSQVGSGWEVTRTDFLTDISLRVRRTDQPLGDTDVRINIAKGSSITWPSIVNGRVIPK